MSNIFATTTTVTTKSRAFFVHKLRQITVKIGSTIICWEHQPPRLAYQTSSVWKTNEINTSTVRHSNTQQQHNNNNTQKNYIIYRLYFF